MATRPGNAAVFWVVNFFGGYFLQFSLKHFTVNWVSCTLLKIHLEKLQSEPHTTEPISIICLICLSLVSPLQHPDHNGLLCK